MKKLICMAVGLCILVLSGCATNHHGLILPIMDSNETPASSSGYVAAMFSRDWNPSKLGFGLGIVETATAEEYVMPFGVETGLPGSVADAFGMIQLPPGEYRIAYWIIYSGNNEEILSQTGISPDAMTGSPFTVESGAVVFIGSHVARYDRNDSADGGKTWSVYHQQLTVPSVQKALSKSYPPFAAEPLSCPSCLK
ncbi:MAG: hypothetical protein KKH12_13355 [Gammaproteobacteria bacterium]|nr:hypothetical protein [Gammaproteobacteria bacterium]MBU1482645.1 hypothetical protein [Gammaproteobacteria bacterium]